MNAVLPTADWKHVTLLSNDSFIIVQNDTVFVSSDAINWSKKATTGFHSEPCGIWDLVKAPKSDSLFILRAESANMDAEVLCSPNGGSTWVNFQTGIPLVGNPNAIDLYVSATGYLFISGYDGRIYRTSKPLALSATELNKEIANVKIYPNPSKDHLYIEYAETGVAATIQNALGQTVYHSTLQGNRKVIDISQLVSGSYILQLTKPNGSKQMTRLQKL